jgi:orotidine-5'-phosphate decarboxylase
MVGIVSARHHVHTQPLSARERLIVALDVPTTREAQGIVDELGDTVSFYKIGLILQLDQDLRSLFERLIHDEKGIFLDFKYIDIPVTIEGAVRAASRLGIKFITVMGQSHIVQAAVKGRGNSALKILAVTLLTGMSEDDMQKEYNTKLTIEQFIEKRAREASLMGCDGVISSPNEVRLIRSAIQKDNFLVVTPAIRQIGAEPDDQKRTATPRDAIINGADYLVVGRPIIQQRNKREATQRIIDEMAAAAIEYQALSGSASLPIAAEIY